MLKSAEAVLKALASGGHSRYAADLKNFLNKLDSADFKAKKSIVEQLRKFCSSHSVRALKVGHLTASEWWELLNELESGLRSFLGTAEQTRIRKLKDSTGASTSICKKALVKTDWNVDKAQDVIEKSGHGKGSKLS